MAFKPQNVPQLENGEVGNCFASSNNGGDEWNGSRPRDREPLPGEAFQPSRPTLLRIINEILQTHCNDIDAIEATATWDEIMKVLKPYHHFAQTLVLHYQIEMPRNDASRILGVTRQRVIQRCDAAIRKLRQPCCRARIRNSIMGWANLYRGN